MSLSYDASGRVCADETRGISSIEYDNDGHPVRIIFESGNEQRDIWDGLGNHLATEYYTPHSMEGKQPFVTKRYGGDGQIECQLGPEIGIPNKVLTYTSFPGGYFDQDGTPHYYITDYQGNNTGIINSIPEITSENNYYPYGEPWRELKEIPFMFSGNERLLVDGLNEYDFHARRYNAAIPAFTSWDACNEKYPWLSPYAFCAGNPVNMTDPSGNEWNISSYRDKDNMLHIDIKISGVVYNASSEKFDMTAVRQAISAQIEDVFKMNGDGYMVSITTDIRVATSIEEIEHKDHVFAIVDQSYFEKSTTLANSIPNGLTIALGVNVVNMTLNGKNNRSIAHELGHTGGLIHPNDIKNPLYIPNRNNNIMTQTRHGNGREFNVNQLNWIIQQYNDGGLNKNSSTVRRLRFTSKAPFIELYNVLNL